MREIPHSTSSGNNELGTSNDESTDPEQPKQMVDPNIPCSRIPLNLSEGHTVSLRRSSCTEDEYRRYQPKDEPNNKDYKEYGRHKEDADFAFDKV